jgi:hypothetical protein
VLGIVPVELHPDRIRSQRSTVKEKLR